MQGFIINITTQDDVTGIRFKLYDNNELVVDNIGTLNFKYLVAADYAGDHTLAFTYYREELPEIESAKQEFYTANFTLPTLNLTITVEVF